MRKNKPFVIAAFAVLVFLFTVVSAFASKQSPPESSSQAPQTVTADNAVQPDPSSSLSDLVVTLEPNQRPRIQQTSYIPESSSESGISSTLDRLTGRIRNLATSFLGTPYRWGGTTPTAFDCSGFTRYVYSKLGVHIPRTAR